MSDLTPTNEESLGRLVQSLGKGERLMLTSDEVWMNVYLLPEGVSDLQFYRMGKEERKAYWKGSFVAIEFHKEAWDPKPNLASRYR